MVLSNSLPNYDTTWNTILTIDASANPITQNGWYRYSASFTNANSGNHYFGLRLSKSNIILDEIQILNNGDGDANDVSRLYNFLDATITSISSPSNIAPNKK